MHVIECGTIVCRLDVVLLRVEAERSPFLSSGTVGEESGSKPPKERWSIVLTSTVHAGYFMFFCEVVGTVVARYPPAWLDPHTPSITECRYR